MITLYFIGLGTDNINRGKDFHNCAELRSSKRLFELFQLKLLKFRNYFLYPECVDVRHDVVSTLPLFGRRHLEVDLVDLALHLGYLEC